MTPTRWQILWASDWLPALWQWAWAFAAAGYAIRRMEPSFLVLLDPWYLLLFGSAIITSFVGGWFASIIPGWFLFGVILNEQGTENGGPFVAGDQVQILVGKHCGSVARVYEVWRDGRILVDLGPAAKEDYTDVFADYQLLRVESRANRRALIQRLNDNTLNRQAQLFAPNSSRET